MKKKNSIFSIVFYVGLTIIAIVIAVTIASMLGTDTTDKYVYSDMLAEFENNRVYEYVYDGNKDTITMLLKEDKNKDGVIDEKTEGKKPEELEVWTVTYKFQDNEYHLFFGFNLGRAGDLDRIQQALKEQGIVSNLGSTEHKSASETPWILEYLPYILLIGAIVIVLIFTMRASSGKMSSFGKSKAKNVADSHIKVTFDDVAGADEEKEELKEVVEYLKNPSRFTHLGARIPHGVLLVGPPGTGKTLLAKAVAGEAGVPFFSMSGSDFVEMYVGVGASRVRDLFEQARKNPAAIIFIDEIDAVGRQRGAGLGGGHDEREQTLNQLLVEMDGFDGHSGIIVMAATNRPDILDSALLRPGRFDRQVTINYPDLAGREAILKVHSKGKPFEASVDMHQIAQTTVGFTGADIANLLNESALLAARRGKSLIGMEEIEDAMIKITVGTQKKAKKMQERERRNTAIHEAGHAILSHILPTQDKVTQISIIPSGRALGYTLTPPAEDKYSERKQEMKERIAMMLGGRVAEQIIFEDYTGGASNDILRATQVARKMVTVYGMSEELGTIHFGSEHSSDAVFLGRDFSSTPDYSETTAYKIDQEIKKIIDEAYNLATKLLTENKDKLNFIADFLLKHETMDSEQFELAMKEGVTMEEVESLVTAKKRRSQEENQRRKEELDEEKRKKAEERRLMEQALGIASDDDKPQTVILPISSKDNSFNNEIINEENPEPKSEEKPQEDPQDSGEDNNQ
ncbi:MAG: ATP-dependent zinc metalloprotease FtsH [Clostridia bacterium]|nr:ATP-dependent zinc metalloprotease FtsH [Clostridia bacterium]